MQLGTKTTKYYININIIQQGNELTDFFPRLSLYPEGYKEERENHSFYVLYEKRFNFIIDCQYGISYKQTLNYIPMSKRYF